MGTWSTLRESLDLSMDAVPARLTQQAVSDWLAALPGVTEVHDLHIWGLSTTEAALTAHLVCDFPEITAKRDLHELAAALQERFQIGQFQRSRSRDGDGSRRMPAASGPR